MPSSHPYFQQLNSYLQWQSQKLQDLDKKIDQLQKEVDTLKQQSTTKVDRIEYKFDQLKIERLEGTLHIGISPDVGKSIEDFTVNGNELQMPEQPADSEAANRIRHSIEQYLSNECPGYIQDMEGKYQTVLGNEYRGFMIEDIRGQIDKRIGYYMKAITNTAAADPRQTKEAVIIGKIKSDIQTAIDQHFQLKQNKGDG